MRSSATSDFKADLSATQPQDAMVANARQSAPTLFCPGCSRFVGDVDTCPYCGADPFRASVRRTLRRVTVALSLLGLGFIALAVWHGKPPLLKAGSVTPGMNHASALVSGVVERAAFTLRRDGWVDYVSFVLSDGTGAFRVSLSGEAARELEAQDLIPSSGDIAQAWGTLQIDAGRLPRLRLRSSAALTLLRAPVEEPALAPAD